MIQHQHQSSFMSLHPAAALLKEAWDRVVADQSRQNALEALYDEDGRNDPTHPDHATYTGLWLKYKN